MRPALLITAALAATLPLTPFARADSSGVSIVTHTDYASLAVTARVDPSVSVRFETTPDAIVPAATDSGQSYVDIPGTVQITMNSGNGVQRVLNATVEVQPDPALQSIEVRARSAAGKSADTSSDRNLGLGYRLNIPRDARDRNFAVPITLSIDL